MNRYLQFVQSKFKFMGCLFAQNMVGKPLYHIYFPQDNNPFLNYIMNLNIRARKHVRAPE